MSLNNREQMHHQLLDALYTAKKQVEYLEAALAHNAAYLGTGVERDGKFGVKPEDMVAPDALIRYLELVEPESDISDYIGSEGVDHTRPRLGPDAPASIRPKTQTAVDMQVGNVALGHPDDILAFHFKAGSLPPGTYLETQDYGENSQPESAAVENSAPTVVAADGRERAAVQPSGGSGVLSQAGADHNRDDRTMLVENVPTPPGAAGQTPSGKGYPATEEQTTASVQALQTRDMPISPSDPGDPREKDSSAGQCRPVTDEDCLRAHNAMQALNYGLWDWNMRTGNVFVSSRWEELLGRPPADLPSALETLTCSFHLEDATRLRQSLAGLLKGQASGMNMPVRYDLNKERGEGDWRTGTIYAACQRVGGKASRLTAVFSDQEGVRQRNKEPFSTSFVSSFFSGMEEGFALFRRAELTDKQEKTTENFVVLSMNEPFMGMCALNTYEEGRLTVDALPGKGAGEWHNALSLVLRESKPVRMPLLRGKDNSLYEVSLFSPEAELVACIAKNVTEPHRLEQEVKRNEARLAALYRLSHMDDTSEDRMVRYCLGEAVRLTGSRFGYVYLAPGPGDEKGHVYWYGDILDRTGKEPTHPLFCGSSGGNGPECVDLQGPEVVNAIGDAMSRAFGDTVAVSRYMLIPIMEEGRLLCVAAVANKKSNYEASDQRQLDLFINGMWFDLRRRRAVRELQRSKEAAESASRSKNEFLANISHELRTPLNGILGMLQVLQKSELTKEQLECVRTATGSGRSLLRIITDILDFARMESGKLELFLQPFDFAATVRSTMGLFSHEAERRKIDFTVSQGGNIPPLLVGDEARVRQIVFNLVGNAVKFTPHGEVRVELELLPYRKNGKYCIYFAVHDSGIGISAEKLNMIFQAFTQLDGSSTRPYTGAGIGLAIVGRLVQLMDGSISVESEPGEGTTIHCSLPFAAAPIMEPLPKQEAPRAVSSVPLDILAVEDDPVNQFTLRTILKKAGHSVLCVPNGREAIEALLLRRFHCVITDIQMPVMDGGEFVRRIREGRTDDIEPGEEVFSLLGMNAREPYTRLDIPVDIPIVALTAHALAGDKERFLEMGINYYLSKPLAALELENILSHISSHVHAPEQQVER